MFGKVQKLCRWGSEPPWMSEKLRWLCTPPRIFLNFAKNCAFGGLSNVDDIKDFRHAILNYNCF